MHINEGMFAENYVSQAIKEKGNKLFYYEKRNKDTHKIVMEIDFLLILNRKITPVEVKTGYNISINSLKKFKERFKEKVNDGIVLYDGDIKIKDNILYLRLFMVELL